MTVNQTRDVKCSNERELQEAIFSQRRQLLCYERNYRWRRNSAPRRLLKQGAGDAELRIAQVDANIIQTYSGDVFVSFRGYAHILNDFGSNADSGKWKTCYLPCSHPPRCEPQERSSARQKDSISAYRETDVDIVRQNNFVGNTPANLTKPINKQTNKLQKHMTSFAEVVETFVFEDEDGRLGRCVAVDDADLDVVVDADVDSLLTSSSSASAATDRRAALAGHLSDGRVHSTHALTS